MYRIKGLQCMYTCSRLMVKNQFIKNNALLEEYSSGDQVCCQIVSEEVVHGITAVSKILCKTQSFLKQSLLYHYAKEFQSKCIDEGFDLTPEKAISFDRTQEISKAQQKTKNGEDNSIHAVSPNKTTLFLLCTLKLIKIQQRNY